MEEKIIRRRQSYLKTINIISILIVFIMSIYMFFILSFRGQYEIILKEKDIESIEELQKKAKEKNNDINLLDLNHAQKIIWYFEFNNNTYTIYYDNGNIEKIYNDYIYEIRDYIQTNGHPTGIEILYLILISMSISIFSYFKISKNKKKLNSITDKRN